jgi:type I restriction enzyme M protein
MSEEDVKIQFLLPYLKERGYNQEAMDFDVAIEVHEGRKKKTIFADVLVYTSKAKKAPLLICETKAPSETLNRSVKEQAISYARLLPQIAPLSLVTNGAQVQVFHTLDKTRLPDLPKRSDLDQDLLKFVLSADTQEALRREAKHELFIIDDVSTFKNILKACHNEIRNNDGMDPTAAFDEMSKVLFCKLYEEKQNAKGNRFRLIVYDDMERLGVNAVRTIFSDAKKAPGYKDLISHDAEINLKDRTLRKIVQLLEDYDLSLTAFDVKGEAFEYFLGDTFTGGLGQYFTPRNVVEFMVEAVDPKIGDHIVDPFCGTGGFLIYAFELVSDKIRLQEFSDKEKARWREELSSRCLFGCDWTDRTSQACKMNMMVHGDGSSGIFKHDGFKNVAGKISEDEFDLCLTNPPFGSFENDPAVLKKYDLGAGRNSQDRVILSVERCLRLVKPEGWVAIVMIDGVLNNKSTKYVRDHIRQNAWIRGVISLNKETFEGYGARAKTSILFLEKKKKPDGGQEPTFLAVASNTGYAPNGSPIPGNVLPDILLDYRAFRKGKPVAQHSISKVVEIKDRLDAEFYMTDIGTGVADISIVRTNVDAAQKLASKAYAALSKANDILGSLDTAPNRLGDILEQTEVREKVEPDKVYRQVGVRWWGDGSFIREENVGREIKAKSLYRVSPGLIIYNRLFAFRGSFAIVPPEQDGCYVSGEFPTFKAKSGIPNGELLCRYVVHCLNSPQYLRIVDKQSTGSTKTSRNRFNEALFENLTVHIPKSRDDLKRVVELLDRAGELRVQQKQLVDLAEQMRKSVFPCFQQNERLTCRKN